MSRQTAENNTSSYHQYSAFSANWLEMLALSQRKWTPRSLACIVKALALFFVLCSFIHSSSGYKNKTKIRNSKPDLLGHLKCVDRNLQRSIVWKSRNFTEILKLKEYEVQYCIVTSCDDGFRKADCYADEERTKKIRRLRTNSCMVVNSEIWSQRRYRVRGVYRGTNGTVKSRYTRQFCVPLDEDTFLGAPGINVTEETTSLDVYVTLDLYLEKTLHKFSKLSIKFGFCVYKSGAECSENSMGYKTSDDPREKYVGLEAGTTYEVQAWYTVTGDASVKSQVATKTVSTSPDPFPAWSKITMSLFVVLVITLLVIIRLTFWKIVVDMRKWSTKLIPDYLKTSKRETELYEDRDESALWNSWAELQKIKYDDEVISLVETKQGLLGPGPPTYHEEIPQETNSSRENLQEANSEREVTSSESESENDEHASLLISIKPCITENIQNPFFEMPSNVPRSKLLVNCKEVTFALKSPPGEGGCNVEMSYVREQLPSDGCYSQKSTYNSDTV